MHTGFVAPSFQDTPAFPTLDRAEIRVEIDGKLVETKRVADLVGEPLGSVPRLASELMPPAKCAFNWPVNPRFSLSGNYPGIISLDICARIGYKPPPQRQG